MKVLSAPWPMGCRGREMAVKEDLEGLLVASESWWPLRTELWLQCLGKDRGSVPEIYQQSRQALLGEEPSRQGVMVQ